MAGKTKAAVIGSEPLESWEEVQREIERIAKLDLAIADQETALNAEMTAVQQRLGPAIEQLKGERDIRANGVLAYTRRHKRDFGEQKSRKFNFGSIVLTKAAEAVKFLVDEVQIIARLKDRGYQQGVVRWREFIDKDALRTAVPAEMRAAMGFEIVKTGGEPTLKIDRKSIESLRAAPKRKR